MFIVMENVVEILHLTANKTEISLLGDWKL